MAKNIGQNKGPGPLTGALYQTIWPHDGTEFTFVILTRLR